MSTIPRELDEAAIIDGAGPWQLFFRVIFPLLRPAIITVIVVSSVAIYNDFVNPLYFLPGNDNATVQLTLFNFQSQFSTRWNLLFTDVLLITIPPLIMFMFFKRQIVSGHDRRRRQGLSPSLAPRCRDVIACTVRELDRHRSASARSRRRPGHRAPSPSA